MKTAFTALLLGIAVLSVMGVLGLIGAVSQCLGHPVLAVISMVALTMAFMLCGMAMFEKVENMIGRKL